MARVPGLEEFEGPIEVTCENARLVARMCELIGFGEELEEPERMELELLNQQLAQRGDAPARDGEWILPEED